MKLQIVAAVHLDFWTSSQLSVIEKHGDASDLLEDIGSDLQGTPAAASCNL
jgi:hypothetical protein